MGKKVRNELQTPEVFEEALREEISVSYEFVLPISVLALRVGGGWSAEATRRALDVLRAADLVCQTKGDEIFVNLPNTEKNGALVVEERLRAAIPEAPPWGALPSLRATRWRAWSSGPVSPEVLEPPLDATDSASTESCVPPIAAGPEWRGVHSMRMMPQS